MTKKKNEKWYVIEHMAHPSEYCISKKKPLNWEGEEQIDGWLDRFRREDYAHGEFDSEEKAIKFIKDEMPKCWELDMTSSDYENSSRFSEYYDDDYYEDEEIKCFGYSNFWFPEEWLENSDNESLGIKKGMSEDELEKVRDKIFNEALDEKVYLTTRHIPKEGFYRLIDYLKDRLEKENENE